MPYRDDALANAGKKKADLENLLATDFSELEAVSQFSVSDSEVAEMQADLGTLFAQQLNAGVMRVGEEICATTKEELDLDENQQHTVVDVPVLLETAQEHFEIIYSAVQKRLPTGFFLRPNYRLGNNYWLPVLFPGHRFGIR